jgi:hypothetical protein
MGNIFSGKRDKKDDKEAPASKEASKERKKPLVQSAPSATGGISNKKEFSESDKPAPRVAHSDGGEGGGAETPQVHATKPAPGSLAQALPAHKLSMPEEHKHWGKVRRQVLAAQLCMCFLNYDTLSHLEYYAINRATHCRYFRNTSYAPYMHQTGRIASKVCIQPASSFSYLPSPLLRQSWGITSQSLYWRQL